MWVTNDSRRSNRFPVHRAYRPWHSIPRVQGLYPTIVRSRDNVGEGSVRRYVRDRYIIHQFAVWGSYQTRTVDRYGLSRGMRRTHTLLDDVQIASWDQ